MEKTSTKITRYTDGDFIIDIITDKDIKGDIMYEAWLSHKLYGIAELMFGYRKKDVPYDRFIEMVEANLHDYEADFMHDRLEEEKQEDYDKAQEAKCYLDLLD